MSRLKNKKVALAVVSGVVIILVNLGVMDMGMSDKVMEITNTILGIGVAIGVFSNPDSHEQE